jgi:two-component system, LytTR family, sensor kinase
MTRPFLTKQLAFYLWMALGYVIIWILHDLSSFPLTVAEAIANNVWRIVYVTAVNYVFFEYAVAFVLRKRAHVILNILLALLFLFLFCMVWGPGLAAWRAFGIALHIYTPYVAKGAHIIEAQMSFSMGAVVFFGIIRHIYKYVRLQQAAQQLRIEKQESELNFLRSQTNPHFLFNTLNNIYSLAKDKSDLAPESIMRLSKILRFMLYEAGGTYISIEKELKIIGDYIDLERLRYDESLRVNFNYDVEDMKQSLPPLLLMPLVENAFKHGASETRGRAYVDIHVSVKQRQLQMVVKNSMEEGSHETVQENIGLSNLRRQLQLLYTDYDLSVQKKPSEFVAVLKINLASHA